jgi:hypothetical protein
VLASQAVTWSTGACEKQHSAKVFQRTDHAALLPRAEAEVKMRTVPAHKRRYLKSDTAVSLPKVSRRFSLGSDDCRQVFNAEVERRRRTDHGGDLPLK